MQQQQQQQPQQQLLDPALAPAFQRVADLVDAGDVNEAVKAARALPPCPALYWAVARAQAGKRRFDRASRVVEEMGLGGGGAADPTGEELRAFVVALVDDAQFALAMKWLPKTDIPPDRAVNAMLAKGHLETALKYIADLKLDALYDVGRVVADLVDQGNVAGAQRYVTRFGLEARFPPHVMVERMLAALQWDAALALAQASPPNVRAAFPASVVAARAVEARDWVSAIKLTHMAGVPLTAKSKADIPEPALNALRVLVRGLVQDKRLFLATRLVRDYRLEDEFPPVELVRSMVREHQFHHALRFMRVFKLQKEFEADMEMITKARERELVEFRRGLRALRGRGAATPDPNAVVTQSIVVSEVRLTPEQVAVVQDAARVRRRNSMELASLSAVSSGVAALRVNGGEDDEEILLPLSQPTQQRPPPPPPSQFMMPPPPPHFPFVGMPPPFYPPPGAVSMPVAASMPPQQPQAPPAPTTTTPSKASNGLLMPTQVAFRPTPSKKR